MSLTAIRSFRQRIWKMMAASAGSSKGAEISKAEYLKRYLSVDEDAKKSKGKVKKKRSKVSDKRWVSVNTVGICRRYTYACAGWG